LANMASRRSGEYFMETFSLPQVGDSNSNICRGSNYSDSGGDDLAVMAGSGAGAADDGIAPIAP